MAKSDFFVINPENLRRKIPPTIPKIDRISAIGFATTEARKAFAEGSEIESDEELKENVRSTIGTPIYDVFSFVGGSYLPLGETQESKKVRYPSLDLETIVINVYKARNIIRTSIQGRNGTVKEFVSDDDYEINLRGYLVGPGNKKPLDLIEALNKIASVPQQVRVLSTYLNRHLGIDWLVIDELNIDEEEGYRNRVPFTLKAYSDVDLEIVELE